MMNNKQLIRIFVLVNLVLLFNTCNNRITMNEKIINTKWISNDTNILSPWNSKLMPTLLSFNDNFISLNYSDKLFNYRLNKNKLFIDGKMRFIVKSSKDNELILENNGTNHRYIPLDQGIFSEEDKLKFISLIQSKNWVLNSKKTEFNNSEIRIFDDNNNFFRGGMFLVFLYNNNLILNITIDGAYNNDIYIIDNYSLNLIILKQLKSNDKFKYINLNSV